MSEYNPTPKEAVQDLETLLMQYHIDMGTHVQDYAVLAHKLYYETKAAIVWAEKAEARVAELENSWLVDESIQPDGSLRPSVKTEASEREIGLLYTHIRALNVALDELCPLVARAIDWLPVNQFTLIAKTREALNNMTDVQNRSYKIDGIVIETSGGDQHE